MQLSERLQMNVSLVPEGARVADIGCDHGYAAIWLVEQGICERVIAMDVNASPLMRAREHVRKAGLETKISCRLSDGVAQLVPGEADTLMLAGMGGPLMVRILDGGGAVLEKITTLVLQPQSEISCVRSYLLTHGFVPELEKACMDGGKYYFAMRAVRCNGDELPVWTEEWQYWFGTYLVQKKDPVLRQYLIRERHKYKEILVRHGSSMTESEKRTELAHRINMIEKCLACMQ